jgi:hypothetical protein
VSSLPSLVNISVNIMLSSVDVTTERTSFVLQSFGLPAKARVDLRQLPLLRQCLFLFLTGNFNCEFLLRLSLVCLNPFSDCREFSISLKQFQNL